MVHSSRRLETCPATYGAQLAAFGNFGTIAPIGAGLQLAHPIGIQPAFLQPSGGYPSYAHLVSECTALRQQVRQRQGAMPAASVSGINLVASAAKSAREAALAERDAEVEALKAAVARLEGDRSDSLSDAAALASKLAQTEAALASATEHEARKHEEKRAQMRQSFESQLSQQLQAAADAEEKRVERTVNQRLHSAEEAHKKRLSEAQAALRRAEEGSALLRQEKTLALEASAIQIRSLTVQFGIAKAKLEKKSTGTAPAKSVRLSSRKRKPVTAFRDTAVRKLLAQRLTEVKAARQTVSELKEKVATLESQLPEQKLGRGQRQRSTAMEDTVTLIAPRTSGSADAPMTARTCEHLRRLVSETNGSFEGASTAISIVLDLFQRGGPRAEQLISATSIKNAYERLGFMDNEAEKVANEQSNEFWACGCDGGGEGKTMEMIASSHWNPQAAPIGSRTAKGGPELRPMSASDLFGDQSAANGQRTLRRAADRLGLKAEWLVANTSDGTEHVLQESEGFLQSMYQRVAGEPEDDSEGDSEDPARPSHAEKCCIHGKALEERAGLEAAMPGERMVGALRLLWEIIHSPEGGRKAQYRDAWVVQAGLPTDLFDSTLGSMPEPTSSKWEVMAAASVKLLPILQPISGHLLGQAAAPTYLEHFLDVNRLLFRGSTDEAKAQRVPHAHVEKVDVLSGIFHDLDIVAAIHLVVDVWEQSYHDFFTFCKSPARFGGWAAPHLRHMMAERAVADTIWYEEARADPQKHLPRLYKWMATPRVRAFTDSITSEKRARFVAMGTAFLEKAQEKHLKWNGSTWTRPHHLLGVLCSEERRQVFASHMLYHLGEGQWVMDWHSKTPGVTVQNEVDRRLMALLKQHTDSGVLGRTLDAWKLTGLAVINELKLLLSLPPRSTEVDPVLSPELTPTLYRQFQGMLFVGLAHNLTLESFVSRLKNLQRIHTNLHPLTVDHMFMYNARQTAARAVRCMPEMRSSKDGGARAAAKRKAEQQKPLSGSANRSKRQQFQLCSQLQECCTSYDEKRLHRRGAAGISRSLRETRQEYDSVRTNLAASKNAALRATCRVTGTGRKRKAPLTAAACVALIGDQPEPGAAVKKSRGIIYKDKRTIREGYKALSARARAQKAARQQQGRGAARRHGTGRQERVAACRAEQRSADAHQSLGSNERAAKQPRAAAVAASKAAGALAREEDEESDEESDEEREEASSDDDMESDDESAGQAERRLQGEVERLQEELRARAEAADRTPSLPVPCSLSPPPLPAAEQPVELPPSHAEPSAPMPERPGQQEGLALLSRHMPPSTAKPRPVQGGRSRGAAMAAAVARAAGH